MQIRLAEPGDAVILDGELVVWNKSRGVFEPFGGVRSAMNAARERVPPDHVSCVTQMKQFASD
jgi:ATP-dependent DNA ligase